MKRLICLLFIFVLLFSLFSNIVLSADEVSQITLSYQRFGNWQDFSGKSVFCDYIDCLRIQTDSEKDYYLSYKTWNEDASGYFSEVKSNSQNPEDYAGKSGKRIRNLSIRVLDKEGNSIDENIVVMYRAFVDGVWLPWVSNAKIEWMSYVQRKYKLDGVLDDKSYNAGINSSYISGLEIRVFEEKSIDYQKGITGKSKLINAPFISQLNSYPTGCESVSAVMALKFRGVDITVDDFIDNYLKKGDADSFDPNISFGGNPRQSDGVGCYSPVIQSAVDKVLTGTRLMAKNVSGLSLRELCEQYVDNNVPVIVWATSGMQKATTGKKIIFEDKTIQWLAPEHCLLLVGYDEENYIFNDPQSHEPVTYYSKNQTENAYSALGCQAVVIVNEPLPSSSYSLAKTEFIYNGKVITPQVLVKDIDETVLKENVHYILSYDKDRKSVGKYKVTVKMKGNYSGEKTLYFNIKPISSSKCSFSLSATSYTYNGKVRTPNVTVKNAKGTVLKKDVHYTVSYEKGRKNVGKYKVTVKMKGNYSGEKTLYFNIKPISSSKCSFSLSATSYTYNGKVRTPNVTVKNAKGTVLKKDVHYTVNYEKGRKNVGTYKVKVKMKGNYSGTKTLTFRINPTKTAVSKLTAGKKSLKVAVAKKTPQVSGYQIQYSTSKSFKSYKTKNLSGYKNTKATIKKLSAKKTYYVRVRTYKIVNSKKYYSVWSAVKYKKTK